MNKCYWVTGLSSTGKTTLSTLLVEYLRSKGNQVIHLDGDELRKVLADNAYTREERIALGMRYSRLCRLLLLNSQNTDIVISVIGLFKELHKWNRENISNLIQFFIIGITYDAGVQGRSPAGGSRGAEPPGGVQGQSP